MPRDEVSSAILITRQGGALPGLLAGGDSSVSLLLRIRGPHHGCHRSRPRLGLTSTSTGSGVRRAFRRVPRRPHRRSSRRPVGVRLSRRIGTRSRSSQLRRPCSGLPCGGHRGRPVPEQVRLATFWVVSAKRPETRARRLATWIECTADRRRVRSSRPSADARLRTWRRRNRRFVRARPDATRSAAAAEAHPHPP